MKIRVYTNVTHITRGHCKSEKFAIQNRIFDNMQEMGPGHSPFTMQVLQA